ncbi:DUF5681 domain-containing protein [Comamonadaceae bacterium OTU4NAUVB1]|nr:DUF5681 domain-containing protein [Comamonadaceae bacterium OTU4NAUVB1]
MPAWKPGQSGNPSGRASKGTIEARVALRQNILDRMPAVVEKLLALAQEGDVQAARTLMERVLPSVKPESLPVLLDMAGATTATEQSALIVKAIVCGQIAPDVGSDLLAGIANAARIADFDQVAADVRQLREELSKR